MREGPRRVNAQAETLRSEAGLQTTDYGRFAPRRGDRAAAQGFAAREVAAGLRPLFVDGAKARRGIEGDACAVAVLVHAADTGALDHEFPGNVIASLELDDEMAAQAAAGAGGEVVGEAGHRPRMQKAARATIADYGNEADTVAGCCQPGACPRFSLHETEARKRTRFAMCVSRSTPSLSQPSWMVARSIFAAKPGSLNFFLMELAFISP